MDYRILRIVENEKYRIYSREWKESGVPRYFAYDKQKEEQVIEFRTIVQARKWLATA